MKKILAGLVLAFSVAAVGDTPTNDGIIYYVDRIDQFIQNANAQLGQRNILAAVNELTSARIELSNLRRELVNPQVSYCEMINGKVSYQGQPLTETGAQLVGKLKSLIATRRCQAAFSCETRESKGKFVFPDGAISGGDIRYYSLVLDGVAVYTSPNCLRDEGYGDETGCSGPLKPKAQMEQYKAELERLGACI